ncbi:hypothetical protein BC834DRAFT_879420 [Gloeopeniophorella convolvens]|nr:hypothetical protein BC834DRAFT_879420 [Gloeopeniophorella convolvens]
MSSPEVVAALDPVQETISDAWDSVRVGANRDPNTSKQLDAVDDATATVGDKTAPFTPLLTTAIDAVEQSDVGKAVQEGIDHFFEGMPVLMNALDAVADLHPFIGVVVMAFKTVYTLELKRRDNEKKIIALYVEMKDMMAALLQLRDVRDEKVVAPDGMGIEDRLKSLVERTADDIKECSNACDTYAKKRLLAKVFQGPLWDNKLLSFVTLFSKRKDEFQYALVVHMTQGVDEANAKLDTVGATTKVLDDKMNVMLAMFQQFVGPEQRHLSEIVAIKGVRAFRDDDKLLFALEGTASTANKTLHPSGDEGHRALQTKSSNAATKADELRQDIFEDPNVAVERNLIVFSRKFEVQKRQIIDELTLVVQRESDRVIQEVRGGPHERILDRSIHELWKEMGWRGNVKARHFVLALRDHYLEELATETNGIRGISGVSVSDSHNPDAWAIKFIDVMRLQPILEAFDDDASGFITISEMNRFTSSRPIDWSLPHWVAYWAIGYRASIIDYARKIEGLFARMEGVRAKVLPPNREAIDDYFRFVWKAVHTLTAAVVSLRPGPNARDKFNSYTEAEETRLGTNLKAVDYIVDSVDTLTLITGVGRIEKNVFPLIYLLMKRHYEIMRVMRHKVLDARELWYAVESILYVKDAIKYRVNDLTNIFQQQKHDPEKQFKNFAYGIFKYFHSEKELWSLDYVRNLKPPVTPYNDSKENQDVKLEDILKYEYTDELTLDTWVYDGHSIDEVPDHSSVESPLRDIMGQWHGYFYTRKGTRGMSGPDTMMTFVLEPDGEREIKANGWSNRGRFTISGSWSHGENDALHVKFKMTFKNPLWHTVFFNGHFFPQRDSLSGIWGISPDPASPGGVMRFRRIPPRYLAVYPDTRELLQNKYRALWRFAITAVQEDLRRDRWSWSYFARRRDDRKTVVSLSVRVLYYGRPLDEEEYGQLARVAQRLTPADACFYGSQIRRIRAYTWVHEGISCDSCEGHIGGARIFCLDCVIKNTKTFDSLDLCDSPRCVTARLTHRTDIEGPHEPTHHVVKSYTSVLDRQHGRVHTAAVEALKRVGAFCAKLTALSEQHQGEERTDQVSDAASGSPSADSDGRSGVAEPTGDRDKRRSGPDTFSAEVEDSKEREPLHSEEEVLQDPGQASQVPQQVPVDALPTCGKCNGPLAFPCWYCVHCEDDLFICSACDAQGVPQLMRSSGPHTEEHHLVRCQAPEKQKAPTDPTEQRLMSLESRLNDLAGRMGNIEQLLLQLAGAQTNGAASALGP